MGYYVLKEAPDVDNYIVWSNNIDGPLFAGPRAELLPWLWDADDRKPDRIEDWEPSHPDKIVQRADETGTSVRVRYGSGPLVGSWEDGCITYRGNGVQGDVKRADLFVLTRQLGDNEDADVADLVEPFE